MSKIYIPEPCHENWNKMNPTEKGRFCKVCTKEVVDFTRKTEQEIMSHLNLSEGSTCGQFTASQLAYVPVAVERNVWNQRMRKAFFSFLAFIGVVGLSKQAKAQKMGKVAIRGDVAYYEDHNTNTSETTLSGQVKTTDGNVLTNTKIQIFSNEILIGEGTTMANGTYLIKIAPGKIHSNKITLKAIHPDYDQKTVLDLAINKSSHRINFTMEEAIMMLGMVVRMVDPIEETPIVEEVVVQEVIKGEVICIKGNPEAEIIPVDTASKTIENTIIETPTTTEKNNPENTETRIQLPEVREEDINGRIYPNPGKERVNLVMNEKSNYQIEIVSISGQLIGKATFTGSLHIIDISQYAPGIYIVKYHDNKTGVEGALRLIKQ